EPDPYAMLLFNHWVALAGNAPPRALLESLLLFSVSPAYMAANPGFSEAFLAGPAPQAAGFAAAAMACHGHDTLSRLGAVRVPTLVVAGSADVLTRSELSRHIVERMPNAVLRLLEAGHMLFWERPAEFSALVRSFLADVP
ncbi:MAG: alpha/beta fold hydrolase, partial [Acidimicrobiales bacterium]